MDIQDEGSGGDSLRLKDLEGPGSGLEPTDKDGGNLKETVSLDSSVHSH